MLTVPVLLVLLVLPPSVLVMAGYPLAVPVFYGAVNVACGFLFWRRRMAHGGVVLGYLASGMFLFSYLIDHLQVSALPPPPEQQQAYLAGSPAEQAAMGPLSGSKWTDWLAPRPPGQRAP